VNDQDLAKALIQAGYVTVGAVQDAAQQRAPGKPLSEVLLSLGLVTQEQLDEVFAGAAPAGVDLDSLKIDGDALALLDRETALRMKCLPLSVKGNTLQVAMANPNDLPAQDEISRVTGKRVQARGAGARADSQDHRTLLHLGSG